MTTRGSSRLRIAHSLAHEATCRLLLLLITAASSSQTPAALPRGCLEFGPLPPHECTLCASGYYLQQADPRNESAQALCVSCIEGCLECDNPDLCLKCDSTHTQRPAESTCEPCDASCETCGEEPATCLSCHTLWVFDPDEHRCSLTLAILGGSAIAVLVAGLLCLIIRQLKKKEKASDELGTPRLNPGRSKKQSSKKPFLTERILDEESKKADVQPIICSMDLIGMINRNMVISQVDHGTDGTQSHAEEYKGLFRSVK